MNMQALKMEARTMAAQVDLALADLINERTNAAQTVRDIMSGLGGKEVKLPEGLDAGTASDILLYTVFSGEDVGEGGGCVTSVRGVKGKKVHDATVVIATASNGNVEVGIGDVVNPETVLRFIEMFL